MDSTRFDILITSLGTASSRRDAVRLIGSGAAGLAAAAGLGAVGAKKAKKKKKKKPATCLPGTLVGTVNVPASGSTVNTPVLQQGQKYRLRAVGFWSSNATHGADAFAAFQFSTPNTPILVFEGTRLGLEADGASPDFWESYNANHVYVGEITGEDALIGLRCTDPVTSDNAGTMIVDVFCA